MMTEGLTRRFDGVTAVDRVSWKLREGEIRAIIGPNGAGKTTFVSMLCGRIASSDGTIRFRGEDVTKLPAHDRVGRGIAYTFQITNIFGNFTVFDNVMLAAQSHIRRRQGRWKRIDSAELNRNVMAALREVGLEEMAAQKASEMAYGHQRLLEVAMGLALKPSLLILDEPTQGLSDYEIENFCALIKRISTDTTILLIEHNMPVVMQLADRITVMNQGTVLAEGTPDEIQANDEVAAAYLGT